MSHSRARDGNSPPRSRSTVGSLLWRAQRLFERSWDEALEKAGMTRAQVALLTLLDEAPGLSGSELARRAHLSVPGVAASLVQMETRGWVRRRPHRAHRRLMEVFLAPAGKRRLQHAQRALRAVDARALHGMGAAERAALKVALARVGSALARTQEDR
jgi:DNA-binding MarR family transcriptional regulator